MKWIIIAILVIILMQTEVKKEGRFGFECSEDESAIEIFRKETGSRTVFEDCGEGKCIVLDDKAVCISAEEEEKKGLNQEHSLLLIAGLIFILMKRRR